MFMCVCIYIYINIYTRIYVCVCISMCVCVCVFIYIYTYIDIYRVNPSHTGGEEGWGSIVGAENVEFQYRGGLVVVEVRSGTATVAHSSREGVVGERYVGFSFVLVPCVEERSPPPTVSSVWVAAVSGARPAQFGRSFRPPAEFGLGTLDTVGGGRSFLNTLSMQRTKGHFAGCPLSA